jgi:hypothetical protein
MDRPHFFGLLFNPAPHLLPIHIGMAMFMFIKADFERAKQCLQLFGGE